MNRIIRFCSLLTASILLSGCFSVKVNPRKVADWSHLEIKYAGSYEIKDYYDVAEERTWTDCLFIDCYIINDQEETIRAIDIGDLTFEADEDKIEDVEFDATVMDWCPWVLARTTPGCSQLLNITPGEKYNFKIPFMNYERKYFNDNPVFDENTAYFIADMEVNPVPIETGLLFTLYQADIDEDGYLQAQFAVENRTGVVVHDISIIFIKGFDVTPAQEETADNYRRVLFADEFQSNWVGANLAIDSTTYFKIPFQPVNDTFDAEYFSQEQGYNFQLVVRYTFTH